SAARRKHPPTAPEQRGRPRRPSRRRAGGGRRRGGGRLGGGAGRRGRGARRRNAHTGPVAAAARAWRVGGLIGAGGRAARGCPPIRRPVVALLACIDDAVAAEPTGSTKAKNRRPDHGACAATFGAARWFQPKLVYPRRPKWRSSHSRSAAITLSIT